MSGRKPSRRAVLAGAVTSIALGRAARAGLNDGARAALAASARGFMSEHRVPGLSIAIAKDGRLVYRDAFGVADREADEALTPDHLFRIASISKPLTSSAVFVLIERGRLRLDDRVFGSGGVLGTAYGTPPYAGAIDAITVEQLLTHTSGGWPNDGTDPMFRYPDWDHARLIGWTLDHLRLKTAPGTAYAYSNFGYCLLGRIIERLTGQPYADHLHAGVLARCRITDMRIAGNRRSDRAPREVVYYNQGPRSPYDMNVTRMDSHGGWLATATDLVRFSVKLSGGLLAPATLASLVTPPAASPSYAKGWRISSSGHRWHTGSLPGTTALLMHTTTGFCWAALCNTRDDDHGKRALVRALDKQLWRMVRSIKDWPAGEPLDG